MLLLVLLAQAGLARAQEAPAAASPLFLPFVSQNFTVVWRPFASTSPWNTPIPANPEIDPNSAAFIQQFSTATSNYDPRFWVNIQKATIPVWFATAQSPLYKVTCPGTKCTWATAVPIPPEARPDPSSDAHMVIIDPTRTHSYDFFNVKKDANGNWTAAVGVDYDLLGQGYRPAGQGSARASGLPAAAGLIRLDEVRSGRIEHALALAYREPGPCFVWPASTNGYYQANPNAMPLGAHLQLDPTLDLNTLGLSAGAKVIARALQEYGAYVVARNSSVIVLTAEPAYAYPSDPWAGLLKENDLLTKLPANRFRVLKMGAQDCRIQ